MKGSNSTEWGYVDVEIGKSNEIHLSFSSLLLSSLELSDAKVYELSIRALLGIALHFCEVIILKFTCRR